MVLLKNAKQVGVFIVGSIVVLVGIAGLVLPIIPGMVVIPIGLAILATEFVWAQSLLKKMKEKANQAADKVRGRSNKPKPLK